MAEKNVYELLGIKPPASAPESAPDSPQTPQAPPQTTPPSAAPSNGAPSAEPPMSGRDVLERGVRGSSFGTIPYTTPETSVMPGTTLLRTLPGAVMRNPLAAGGVSGGMEAISQASEKGVGARESFDPIAMALSTILPPLMSTATAVPSAVKRTVQRVLPGRFAAAHEGAQAAGRELVQNLKPPEGAVAEFGAKAAQLSDEPVAVSSLRQIFYSPKFTNISRLPNPVDKEAAAVKNTMENLNTFMKPDGTIPLGGLEAVRDDIGKMTAQGYSKIRQIYGGIVQDLENSAAAGGQGAEAARNMAEAYKQTLGAKTVEKAIADATSQRAIGSADVNVLNIGKFAQAINKKETRDQLTKHLGLEGLALIDDFVTQFRRLPPAQANTAWNAMVTGIAGIGGGIAGAGAGPVGAAAGAVGSALGVEFTRNLLAVARTPGAWSRIMTTAAQAARTGLMNAPAAEEP